MYDLLSPGMQKYLEGLEALHSAQIQADGSIALGRTVRREPVVTKHPLIRTHPVTGWKSVFFNPGMSTLEAIAPLPGLLVALRPMVVEEGILIHALDCIITRFFCLSPGLLTPRFL